MRAQKARLEVRKILDLSIFGSYINKFGRFGFFQAIFEFVFPLLNYFILN